jgi:hypothetical protein
MWGQVRGNLEPELREVLAEQGTPQSLEQIVQQLFFRRQRFSELLILSRASIRAKQKLKRDIERCLERGIAEKSWLRGTAVYSLKANAAGEPLRAAARPSSLLERWLGAFRKS